MAVMGSRAKVLVTLSYDGTRYHGFQVQQNALSVCEVLQNALEQLYGVLSEDPRPRYHDDPDRIYGFSFCGFEIKFQVHGNILSVLSVIKL